MRALWRTGPGGRRDGMARRLAGRNGRAYRVALAALGSANLVVLMESAIPSPLYPLYAAQWGLGPALVGIVYAAYPLAVMAGLLPAGRLSDRFPRRLVVVGALALGALADAAFLAASNAAALVVGRLFAGAAVAAATSAVTPALTELGDGRDTRTPALVTMTTLVGGFSLGVLVSALATRGEFAPLHAPYAAHLILSLGATALVLRGVPAGPRAVPSPRRTGDVPLVATGARVSFTGASLTLFCAFSVMGLYLALAPTIARQQLRIAEPLVGALALIAFLLASVGAQLASRRIADDRALPAGLGAACLGLGLAALAARSGLLAALVAGALIGGAGSGVAQRASLAIANRVATPARRGAAIARYYVVGYAGTAFPLLVGLLTAALGIVPALLVFTSATTLLAVAAVTLVRIGSAPAAKPSPPR